MNTSTWTPLETLRDSNSSLRDTNNSQMERRCRFARFGGKTVWSGIIIIIIIIGGTTLMLVLHKLHGNDIPTNGYGLPLEER